MSRPQLRQFESASASQAFFLCFLRFLLFTGEHRAHRGVFYSCPLVCIRGSLSLLRQSEASQRVRTIWPRVILSHMQVVPPNKSLQPTPGSVCSSAARFTSLGPAWLSLGR